jgi:hypothetical protein
VTVPAVAQHWNLSGLSDSLTDPNLPYAEFEGLCERLGNLYAAVKWADAEVKLAIGDAILAGEHLYGQEAYQAFERFEVSEETRKECVRIARQVPRSIRKVGRGLSWSHLRAVAPLEPKEQREWLKRATDEGMSHHALRDALRNGTPVVREVCPTCGRAK